MLDYNKLMAKNPTELMSATNDLGQRITFVEHPTRGEEYPVIAVFKDQGKAFATEFFDCGDFYAGSDYMPVLTAEGRASYMFETHASKS